MKYLERLRKEFTPHATTPACPEPADTGVSKGAKVAPHAVPECPRPFEPAGEGVSKDAKGGEAFDPTGVADEPSRAGHRPERAGAGVSKGAKAAPMTVPASAASGTAPSAPAGSNDPPTEQPDQRPPSRPDSRSPQRACVPAVKVGGGAGPQAGDAAGAVRVTIEPTNITASTTSPAATPVPTAELPVFLSSTVKRHAAHPVVAAVFAEAEAHRAAGGAGAAERVLLENRLIGLGLSGEIPPRDAFDLQYELDRVLQETNTAVAAADRN